MDKINELQKIIDESNNIVFFGGAGVSTESGIPDFRGKNGLYTKKKDTDELPEYMLSSRCLYKEPEKFFKYYKENMDSSKFEPNVTHKYLKELEDKNKLSAIVTQNIDGLHQRAGSKKVYEIHGTTEKAYCETCFKEYKGNYIFESDGIPKCSCGGTVRPDVVLYGEMLPDAFSLAQYYISKADVLIVAGTSLTVQPASGLVDLFHGKHLIIINATETDYDNLAEIVIHDSLKNVFGKLK